MTSYKAAKKCGVGVAEVDRILESIYDEMVWTVDGAIAMEHPDLLGESRVRLRDAVMLAMGWTR